MRQIVGNPPPVLRNYPRSPASKVIMKTRSPGGSVGRRPRCRRATLPNMRIPAATFLAAVVLLTAGCGGDEGAENTSGGKPASAGLPTGTVSLATVTDENVEQACVTLFGDVADIGRFFSEAEYTWEASVFNEDYLSGGLYHNRRRRSRATERGQGPRGGVGRQRQEPAEAVTESSATDHVNPG